MATSLSFPFEKLRGREIFDIFGSLMLTKLIRTESSGRFDPDDRDEQFCIYSEWNNNERAFEDTGLNILFEIKEEQIDEERVNNDVNSGGYIWRTALWTLF